MAVYTESKDNPLLYYWLVPNNFYKIFLCIHCCLFFISANNFHLLSYFDPYFIHYICLLHTHMLSVLSVNNNLIKIKMNIWYSSAFFKEIDGSHDITRLYGIIIDIQIYKYMITEYPSVSKYRPTYIWIFYCTSK